MLGLLPIDEGQVYADGVEITSQSERHHDQTLRRFGVLFQQGALFDSLSTWQNVAFGLIEGRGMALSSARMVALAKMASVGLGADVAELTPGRTFRGHAQTGSAGTRNRN